MEIIVEGYKIDTKDIWKIEGTKKRGYDGLVIGITDKPDIVLEEYTDNLFNHNRKAILDKYDKLRKAVEEKWNEDKNDIPTFKL